MNEVIRVDSKKSYYAIVPANVRYDKCITNGAKLLYGEITALSNQHGYCWASNSYFAKLYNVSNKTKSRLISQLNSKCEKLLDGTDKTISRLISQLKNNNYIILSNSYNEGTNEIDRRYIQICPYPMDINVHTPMDKKVKDNTTSINTTNNKEHLVLFEEWWNLYDNKKDKRKCRNKYKVLLKKYSHEEIIEGTKRYLDHLKLLKESGEFVPNKKYPHTFLNGENFNDEYEHKPRQKFD